MGKHFLCSCSFFLFRFLSPAQVLISCSAWQHPEILEGCLWTVGAPFVQHCSQGMRSSEKPTTLLLLSVHYACKMPSQFELEWQRMTLHGDVLSAKKLQLLSLAQYIVHQQCGGPGNTLQTYSISFTQLTSWMKATAIESHIKSWFKHCSASWFTPM